ncbi:L,D-transpeptidase family protein [Sphingomonas sp. MMS24-J13]|uniref:L,D-transpeptidase family protein n=1 Tax=Sphingomonas sp. MMS24-J13 TaxID=3238686 RepID=UPI00384D415B
MKGLERNAALARRGVFLSVAVLAAVWNPSIGSTQQPDPAEQRVPVGGRWSAEAVGQLVKVIESARAEGLDPSAYNLVGLRQVAENGQGPALDAVADAAAVQLAHDYYFGRVSDRDDMGWMIQRPAYEPQELAKGLQQAIASGEIRKFYASLLPSDPRYAALREALAQTDDPSLRDRLRVNMERWRWMPRGLGDDYLYVNVPSYKLQVMTDGASVASYDVVVGAPKTRTPMLASPTNSFVVNPWWNVPASIVKSSNLRPGKGGYQFKASANGGYAVRQPPGPRNALGKIKFNLANDQAIYLHDTPAKSAFGRDERALSHGCIRVKNIDQLAAQLLGEDGGDTAQFDEALASPATATLRLPRTWQVYIVYFTLDGNDPTNLASYSDPYGYDAQILTRLDSRPIGRAVQVAALR